jgi:hypothetical protein
MQRSLLLLALAACASSSSSIAPSPKPNTRGLRADQHLDAAQAHERRADELARWPETRRSDTGRFDDPNGGLWYRAWDQPQEHARLASIHRSEAAQIQAAYDEACANVAPEHVRISPLKRYAQGGMPTEDGVVVFLGADAVPPDRLLAEMRCHRAWMMLGHAEGVESCPLDLPEIRVEAHGDATGASVEITVKDRSLVPELQRRAAHDLEVAAQRRAASTSH